MWDVLFNALLGAAAGAAAGYAAYKIVEALWPKFVKVWEGFVASAQEIFGYITDATKDFLASVTKFLQDNWSEMKSSIRETFGYIQECVVVLFGEGNEAYLGFLDSQENSSISSLGQAPSNVQLPNPNNQVLAATLDLRN
ncbi:secreted protein [Beggiatoa sp. PS]|nr:secreted protein [Beggiatoa sp. PS]